jgi:hypothetical protein
LIPEAGAFEEWFPLERQECTGGSFCPPFGIFPSPFPSLPISGERAGGGGESRVFLMQRSGLRYPLRNPLGNQFPELFFSEK